jgi:diguanylate cyclase (GGDEF)-like protein
MPGGRRRNAGVSLEGSFLDQSAAVPVIVVSRQQERAEAVNSCLRNGGRAARVRRWSDAGELRDQRGEEHWQLCVVFADEGEHLLANVSAVLTEAGLDVPVICCRELLDEDRMAQDMATGAHDCITLAQTDRMLRVLERELRRGRLQRSLREAVASASQHREQLRRVMAGTADAIAHVGEGIVLDANRAWVELFGHKEENAVVGLPFMDMFDAGSQPAIKGALVACDKGRWPEGQTLRADSHNGGGRPVTVHMEFEQASFDGEACVRVRVPARVDDDAGLSEELEDALRRDPDTGLYSRRHLLAEISGRLGADPPGGVRGLVMIALDELGKLERQLGPEACDKVIAGVADLLRDVIQPRDLYGRLGSGLFGALIARGNRRELRAWAETVLGKAARTLFEADGKSVSVSLSAGVAVIDGRPGSIDGPYGEALEALERAVEMGGSQAAMSKKGEDSTRVEQMDQLWTKRIKKALMDNRFRLALQPIASLSGEESGLYDLLVRMLDEQGEEILPAAFMPPAQRNQLLKNIDRWVIGAAFSFALSKKPTRAFVRLSQDTMLDSMLPAWLETQVRNTGLDPAVVVFQVTEESAAAHLKQTREMAARLKRLGFGFALDGFSGGPGSAQLMGHVPIDYLKIDGTLMQGLAGDELLQERVKAVVDDARLRKVRTIAERVEDANTMAVLWQLGVQYIQGYQVSEPEVVLGE